MAACWCSMHHKRWKRHGDPLARVVHRGDPETRYWSKVDRRGPDECWPWTGATYPSGHGTLWWDGTNVGAHRIALLLAHGEMPTYVRHSCDNPPCQNPAHLLTGTHHDNMGDMSERARTAGQRLTGQDAVAIRAAAAAGETHGSIAARYGVDRSTISQAVRGVTHRRALPAASR